MSNKKLVSENHNTNLKLFRQEQPHSKLSKPDAFLLDPNSRWSKQSIRSGAGLEPGHTRSVSENMTRKLSLGVSFLVLGLFLLHTSRG